jgi:rhodanese-related sulfurtransferase
MENLSQAEWRKRLSESTDAVIIDVRTPEEWEEGIVPGAKKLNIFNAPVFMAEIETMERDKEYFMYCRSGGRSGQAGQIMASKGFDKVYNLNGGMMEWEGELIEE